MRLKIPGFIKHSYKYYVSVRFLENKSFEASSSECLADPFFLVLTRWCQLNLGPQNVVTVARHNYCNIDSSPGSRSCNTCNVL